MSTLPLILIIKYYFIFAIHHILNHSVFWRFYKHNFILTKNKAICKFYTRKRLFIIYFWIRLELYNYRLTLLNLIVTKYKFNSISKRFLFFYGSQKAIYTVSEITLTDFILETKVPSFPISVFIKKLWDLSSIKINESFYFLYYHIISYHVLIYYITIMDKNTTRQKNTD